MMWGICSYCYGWAVSQGALSAEMLLEKAARFRLPLVQLSDHLPLLEMSAPALRALRSRADSLDLKLEVGIRGFTEEQIMKGVKACEALDARMLRIVIDLPNYEPDTNEVLEIFHRVAPALQAADVVLAIENHDRFSSRMLSELIREADSPQLGICLDMVNSIGAGEGIETVLQNLLPLAVNIHFKDFAIKRLPHLQGFIVEGRPLGQGMLPAKTILSQIADLPHEPNVLLELWTPPESDMQKTLAKESEWVAESVSAMCALLL